MLTLHGLSKTRSRARDLIKRGVVTVDGRVERRPGAAFPVDVEIAVHEEWNDYVSRGALKLVSALDLLGFDCEGRVALDLGASTGGFTQVMLRRGARRVYAVDVGKEQLHPDLAGDARIVVLENTDARRLDSELIPEPVSAITADVSFISLTKVLPTVLKLAAPAAWCVALIKPQFEVGREHVGKGGIVKSEQAREAALNTLTDFFANRSGWRVEGTMPSPIEGGSGNREYLIGARYEP